ncbi:hypothetical protein M0R89_11320 [Halorussus limi]|uniref:Uncharacterized protein n=1 Tax=Halorussus limi TaxID=2938695 RepID=A0A8U0HQH8_9EURY|nr:hypothetical protein [Halorussus limi]UPV73137.1 hypothetical protein M0R89_11320 [Halorussus limi]
MSDTEKPAAVARHALGRLVAYAREFGLIAAYAVVTVAICAPTVIGTGAAIYWLSVELGLEGTVRTVYFGVGVVVIMFVFAMLHRFVERLGRELLGPTREPWYQV